MLQYNQNNINVTGLIRINYRNEPIMLKTGLFEVVDFYGGIFTYNRARDQNPTELEGFMMDVLFTPHCIFS